MKTKVLYNNNYGGFSLSKEATKILNDRHNLKLPEYGRIDGILERHDHRLIEVVEELGLERASGDFAQLEIKKIKSKKYYIDSYDGWETVMTSDKIKWIKV